MSKGEIHIIKNALSGDRSAMQTLYEQHERHWFRLCLRYGKNRTEAQDILQDGLMLVFRDLNQFDPERGKFSSWSNRVMVHAALRYLQKHQWQHSFEDLELAENAVSLSEGIVEKITAKELTEVIQKLPTGYRVVFNMFAIEGYSHKEIAEMLRVSVGTSKSQLSKAKKMLRQQLEILF